MTSDDKETTQLSEERQSTRTDDTKTCQAVSLHRGSSRLWEPGAGSAPQGMLRPGCCHGNTSPHS